MRTCDNLDIILEPPDVPGAVHTNGDRIKGQVRLFNGHTLDIDQIAINFKGKTKSRAVTQSRAANGTSSRQIHYAKGILFNFKKDLTVPNIAAPSYLSCAWSFEFVIPWESQYAEQPYPFVPHGDFEHQPGFLLPPTLDGSADTGYQAIYYYLEVVANDRQATLFHKKKARLHINFAPSRPTLAPLLPYPYSTSTSLSRCTKKLDPELVAQEQQLTVTQKTRRLFSKNEPKPTTHFTIWSTVPYQGTVGGPFPIFLGITHDTARSTAPEVPVITLTNINARLTSYTYGRVPYHGLSNMGSAHYAAQEYKIYFLNRSFSIPMYEKINLGEHLASMVIPDDLVTGFRSYNVSRRYELKVTADLMCVGEKYQIKLSGGHGGLAFNLAPRLCKARFDHAAERRAVEEEQRIAEERRRIAEQRRRLAEEQQRAAVEQQRTAESLQGAERFLPISDEEVESLPKYEEIENKGPPVESR